MEYSIQYSLHMYCMLLAHGKKWATNHAPFPRSEMQVRYGVNGAEMVSATIAIHSRVFPISFVFISIKASHRHYCQENILQIEAEQRYTPADGFVNNRAGG